MPRTGSSLYGYGIANENLRQGLWCVLFYDEPLAGGRERVNMELECLWSWMWD